MHKVFVNYRVGRGDGSAALIERGLTSRFGPGKIFRAGVSIPAGADFQREILKAVRHCEVLLAVIGPDWANLVRRGGPALEDEDDWVRREILEAFQAGVTVIPVLVGSAPRLTSDDLPPELRRLARCQDRRFSHASVDDDIDRLAKELIRLVPDLADGGNNDGDGSEAPKPAVPTVKQGPNGAAIVVTTDRFTVHGDLYGGSRYGGDR
jgi:hypothetical protein